MSIAMMVRVEQAERDIVALKEQVASLLELAEKQAGEIQALKMRAGKTLKVAA